MLRAVSCGLKWFKRTGVQIIPTKSNNVFLIRSRTGAFLRFQKNIEKGETVSLLQVLTWPEFHIHCRNQVWHLNFWGMSDRICFYFGLGFLKRDDHLIPSNLSKCHSWNWSDQTEPVKTWNSPNENLGGLSVKKGFPSCEMCLCLSFRPIEKRGTQNFLWLNNLFQDSRQKRFLS